MCRREFRPHPGSDDRRVDAVGAEIGDGELIDGNRVLLALAVLESER